MARARSILAAAAFALLVTGCAAAPPAVIVDAGRACAHARQVLDDWNGDTDELQSTMVELKLVMRQDPENAAALVQLARAIRKSGYRSGRNYSYGALRAAADVLHRAIRLEPGNFEAHVQLAYCMSSAGDRTGAEREIATAERFHASAGQILVARATCAADAGDSAGVLRYGRAALAEDLVPYQRVMACDMLGPVLEASGDFGGAESTYTAILAIRPQSPWTCSNFANFLTRRQQYARAITYARHALDLMDFGNAHRALGRAYFERGLMEYRDKQPAPAMCDFDSSVTADPDLADAHVGRGVCLRQLAMRNRDVAILDRSTHAFETALHADPGQADARAGLVINRGMRAAIERSSQVPVAHTGS